VQVYMNFIMHAGEGLGGVGDGGSRNVRNEVAMISRIRLGVAAKMVSRAARVARGGSYGTRNTYPVCGRISRTSLDGDSDAWRQ